MVLAPIRKPTFGTVVLDQSRKQITRTFIRFSLGLEFGY